MAKTKDNSVNRKNLNQTKSNYKSSKKKGFRQTRLYKILRAILIIIILIGIINAITKLTKKTPENITLVIGEEKIDLKNNILSDKENNLYISMDDIANLYDSNIFYNDGTMITTFNKHIAVLELNKNTMSVNDVVQEISGILKEEKNIVYLPFLDMKDVYDFEYQYNSDEKVLIVDSMSKEKNESIILKNCQLKEKNSTFAKTIEKLKKSEYVTVFETNGDYAKVRSSSGNIGYVKMKKLSDIQNIRENMDEDILSNITVLDEYKNVDSSYEVLQENNSENAMVMPNLFNITEENEKIDVKSIIDLSSTKYTSYAQWAENSGITICPTVTLSTSMNKLCSSYITRTYIINTLYNQLITNKLAMICVDFEDVDDTEGLYRFIIEMAPRFKSAGMKILIKDNTNINKDRLKNIVDYVF